MITAAEFDWKAYEAGVYGDHLIIHGDCRDVLSLIPKEAIDLVLTDPPYFLPSQTNAGTREKSYRRSLADMSIFETAFDVFCREFSRVLKDTGTLYMFCDAQSYPFLYRVCFPLFKNVRTIIWDRMTSYNGYTWRRQHEIILWSECEEAERIPTGDGDVIRERAVEQDDRNHPVEKPLAVIQRLIVKSPAKLILDPFAGSCTTAVAARNLGRRSICIEIERKYCEIGEQRLAQEVMAI